MITVIDAPCGTGKTRKAIEYMKANPDTRFIYITPFLSEVERIKKEVPNTISPSNKNSCGTKLEGVRYLLRNSDYNIASTHSLFERFSPEMADLIKTQHMVLILDEVMDVVRELDKKSLPPDDIPILLESKCIDIDKKTGKITWIGDINYDGVCSDIMDMIMNGQVYAMQNKETKEYFCFIWTFPPDVFEAFDDIYILTYLYQYQLQRHYYDFHKIKYEIKTLKNNTVVPYELQKRHIDKIHIYEGKQNDIGKIEGNNEFALSHNWFNTKTEDSFVFFKRSLNTMVKKHFKSKSKEIIWTTYKDQKEKLKGKGYSKGFLPCNTRSTNEYINCHYVMYLLNRYINPFVKFFFDSHGVTITKEQIDMYALSEMIQFIYRSAVRNGEDVYVYVPSERMRNLLHKYIQLA